MNTTAIAGIVVGSSKPASAPRVEGLWAAAGLLGVAVDAIARDP
jgi:hypothetical protein